MLNAFSALRRLRLRSLADELEIERLTAERDDFRAKFKLAATDLAKQAEEIEAYKEGAKALHRGLDEYMVEINAQKDLVSALTDKNVELIGKLETARGERDAAMTDAQKWRDSLKRSRDRKEAKKNATPPARDKRAKNRGGK